MNTTFCAREIQNQVPMMVDAYYALGAAEIERHNYNMNEIGKQIQENESQQLLTSEKVCGEVYDRLKTGDKLPVCVVNRFMNDLIMRLGNPLPQKSDGKDDRNIFRVQGGAHQQTTVHRIGKADHIARNG